MNPLCQVEDDGVTCGLAGVWQHPIERVWCCDRHAPLVRDRARCIICGKPGAVRRFDLGGWLCMEHRPG
jgi:hypothetical protein